MYQIFWEPKNFQFLDSTLPNITMKKNHFECKTRLLLLLEHQSIEVIGVHPI